MTVYFITIGILLILCWFLFRTSYDLRITQQPGTLISTRVQLQQSKRMRSIVFLVFLVLAFVAAFRYKVGTDFNAYYRSYGYVNKFARGDYSDPGFTIFAIIADFIFQGKNGSLTILSAIVSVALFVFTIAKRSENFFISIFLFIFVGCFTGMFNGVRQYLATAILFAGFCFVQEKKFFKWLLIVLLASTIHVTAILMILIYPACNMKSNAFTVAVYFAFALAMLYFYEPLFNLVGALKGEEINSELGYMIRGVNVIRIIVQCVPLIMFLFVGSKKINEDQECKTLFNVCLLNAAIAVASMNSAYFARFFIYTMCFQILMYPKIFSKLGKTDRYIFVFLLLFFFSVFWLYEVSISRSLNNFQWIFNYL